MRQGHKAQTILSESVDRLVDSFPVYNYSGASGMPAVAWHRDVDIRLNLGLKVTGQRDLG
jgi:hypothetical protein